MLAWVAPLLVFTIVVFVHELGHFLAAKLVGVYAPRFSIGMGPALLKRRWGETEYVLAAFPIGGYVRMASREDEATAFLEGGSEEGSEKKKGAQKLDPDAMIPFGPKPIPQERWFESKPLGARLLILLAGVTMNVLLGFVVLTGMFTYYGEPYLTTRADSLVAGRPAAAAGMRGGDSIVAVNGTPVRDWENLVQRIGSSAGVPLTLHVIRDGIPVQVALTPVADTATNLLTGKVERVGRIGIVPEQASRPLGFGRSVQRGWSATLAMSGSVFRAVRDLITREVSPSQLGGPIMIATASVQAAQGGMEQLLLLIALISVNLAVFNLLPIPLLDGGQILLNIAETIKGGALSARTRDYILRGGLALIILLFVLVMYNDLRRLIVGLIGA